MNVSIASLSVHLVSLPNNYPSRPSHHSLTSLTPRDVRGKAIAAPREARAEVEGAQAALRDTEDVNRRLRREVEVLRGEVAELRLGRGGGGGGVGGAGMGGGAGAGAGMGGGGIAGAGVGGPLAAAMAAAAGGAAVAAQRAGLAPHELQALRNEAQLLRMKLRQREVRGGCGCGGRGWVDVER